MKFFHSEASRAATEGRHHQDWPRYRFAAAVARSSVVMPELYPAAPAPLFHFVVTLGLAFVLGLEREETAEREHASIMAGVRTMPLVALLAHMLVVVGGDSPIHTAIGFMLVGGFSLISYAAKLRHERSGTTTELTVLIAYAVGLLSAHGDVLTATAVTVASVLLLTSKQPLRQFARAIPPQEITTFVTFLLLAVVILPALPHQEFTRLAAFSDDAEDAEVGQ